MESEAKGAPKVPDKMNTTRNKLPVLLAGFFAFASSAMSAEQTLPTPPPSEFADRETSTTVPIPTDEGRHLKLTLAFEPTPSNAVLVAFGRDLNGSETLEPEETELIVGCDCGAWFGRDEGRGMSYEGWRVRDEVGTIHLKQPRELAERWTLAKVTAHNLADTNLAVTADFYTKGMKLILR